jgi:cysteine-rich repeat protein
MLHSNGTVLPGVWYHIVAIRDAASFSLYIDGALHETKPLPNYVDDDGAPFLIGGYLESSGGSFMYGLIDEVKVYRRALTPDQIAAQYAAGPAGGCRNAARCGDGVTQVPEQCDDGNGVDGDCCTSACRTEAPGEVTGVAARSAAGVTTVTWNPPATGKAPFVYDTVRSSLRSDYGSSAVCIESGDGSDLQATDAASPPSGTTFYYLVRAENACGAGTAGTTSKGACRDLRPCP